ncbi:transmembrane ion channel [Lewinellaceae bacterium SD302]|nr:transmembrane ion channel [Lewinellaceae bacterium SD302]
MNLNISRQFLLRFSFLFVILMNGLVLSAQQTPDRAVVFKGDTLYYVQGGIGTFTPELRAERVMSKLNKLAKLPLNEFDNLRLVADDGGTNIVYEGEVIASVTEADARMEGVSSTVLAERHLSTVKTALINDFSNNSFAELAQDLLFFLLSILVLYFIFRGINWLFDRLRSRLQLINSNVIFRHQKIITLFNLISPEAERGIWLFTLRMLRFTAFGVVFYLFLPFLFSHLSFTRGFGERLFGYLITPVKFVFGGLIGYLPKFLFIVVICVAVHYLLKAISFVAHEIKHERFHIGGFYPDWAVPTANIFKTMIIIFTLVIVFPYLPGAGSDAFQGVSVFVGLLLSLGSAGVISNVISGVILTYMRPFQVGDRVKIADTVGDVLSKNLLVTKIKTLKNEESSLPNSLLLSGGIINYTRMAAKEGLILHTTVTIGYDVPWQQVHELLLNAAANTEHLKKEPVPFILQKSLDDWYVAYELNAYTGASHQSPRIYSQLHANIQNEFNRAGVEIMSPHYRANRDGNASTVIPPS